MYFENYLPVRGGGDLNQPKFMHPTMDVKNKVNGARPPAMQNHVVFNKPTMAPQDLRPDTNRQCQSSNVTTTEFKKNSQMPKAQNYTQFFNKPENPISNNYINFQTNIQKPPENKKYICLSPAKTTNRVSAGLVFEDGPQIKSEHRRSDSNADLKSKDINGFPLGYYVQQPSRQIADYASPALVSKNVSHNVSTPFIVNFGNSMAYGDSNNSKVFRKQSVELVHSKKDQQLSNHMGRNSACTKRENNGNPFVQQFKMGGDKSTIIPKFEQETIKPQFYSTNNSLYNDSVFKQSTVTNDTLIRKDSHNEAFGKKYSNNSCLDNLEKDIQKLKLASKQADQIYDREINKNSYLNKLMEQRGLKPSEDQKAKEVREKKELQAKLVLLQKELDERSKQLGDKNREICEKSKIIIEKNKTIDNLLIDIRQIKNLLEEKQNLIKNLENRQEKLTNNNQTQKNNQEKYAIIKQLQKNIEDKQAYIRHVEKNLQEKMISIKQLKKNAEEKQVINKQLEKNLEETKTQFKKLQKCFEENLIVNKQLEKNLEDTKSANIQIEKKLNEEKQIITKQYEKNLEEKQTFIRHLQKNMEEKLICLKNLEKIIEEKQSNIKKLEKSLSIKSKELQQNGKRKHGEQINKNHELYEKIKVLQNENEQKSKVIQENKTLIQSVYNQLQMLNIKYRNLQLEDKELKNNNDVLIREKVDWNNQRKNLSEKLKNYENLNRQLKILLEEQKNKFTIQQRLISDLKKQQPAKIQKLSKQYSDLSQKLSYKEQICNKMHKELVSLKEKMIFNQAKLVEITVLLFNKQFVQHQILLNRLKQLKQFRDSSINADNFKIKQFDKIEEFQAQKMHQQFLQKRFQQLNRQLKRVNSRLCVVGNDAQQGFKIVRDINNQIVILNLINLNQKYRLLQETK